MVPFADVIVVGAHIQGQVFHVDRMPLPGETLFSHNFEFAEDGGKASNQAIALGRLRINTAFIGKVGSDQFGRLAEKWLKDSNVETSGLLWSNDLPTSTGIILLDQKGMNMIVNGIGASQSLTFDEINKSLQLFTNAKYLLTGFEIPIDVALSAAKLGKKMGMKTIINPGPAPEFELGDMHYVDLLIPNETEAKIIAYNDPEISLPPSTVAQSIIDKHQVKAVVITLGDKGCFCLDSNGSWTIDAIPCPVADTTGAGDAFCAGLTSGLVEGLDLRLACQWANHVASLSVSKPGTIPSFPTFEEVRNYANLSKF